jgi:hypothetical protein
MKPEQPKEGMHPKTPAEERLIRSCEIAEKLFQSGLSFTHEQLFNGISRAVRAVARERGRKA